LIWPRNIAPADVHLVATGKGGEIVEYAEKLVQELSDSGIDVMFDDRPKVSPGVKFGDAELLGVPTIVVVGRGYKDGKLELKDRRSGETREIDIDSALEEISREIQQ
ncbi:MAG: His/Gly/Thr/Pro-type tRNA ligase C-terminal domain-containing protein, partial [Rothia sp. (in: high G+C Gram-positive bacteria)]|nr:His/Gly/Thr/Pro-type tRNA ligase C-terminal domain-containing protein [Rothia sp. (in: high G+C Gram-positive bacteria)]